MKLKFLFLIMICGYSKFCDSQSFKDVKIGDFGLIIQSQTDWRIDSRNLYKVIIHIESMPLDLFIGDNDLDVNAKYDMHFQYLKGEEFVEEKVIKSDSSIWSIHEKGGLYFVRAVVLSDEYSYRLVGKTDDKKLSFHCIDELSKRIKSMKKSHKECDIESINQFKTLLRNSIKNETGVKEMNEMFDKVMDNGEYPEFVMISYKRRKNEWTVVFEEISYLYGNYCLKEIDLVSVETFDNDDQFYVGNIIFHSTDNDVLSIDFQAVKMVDQPLILFKAHEQKLNESKQEQQFSPHPE